MMKIKKIETKDNKSLIFVLNNLCVQSISFFESDLIITNMNNASVSGKSMNLPQYNKTDKRTAVNSIELILLILINYSKLSKVCTIIVFPKRSEFVSSILLLLTKPIPLAYHSSDEIFISIAPISLSPINFVLPVPLR